jgi:tripartite-type tricarboxylate transporter receptor subunit TctC
MRNEGRGLDDHDGIGAIDMNMKLFLRAGAFITALALSAGSAAFAQPYPSKSVRWVVGYSAGGGSDVLARTVAVQLSKQLGQQVLIDNRPGGAQVIAAEIVKESPPDGYTVLTGDNGTLVYNTALFNNLPYDPQKDFAPVGLMARFPLVLVANPAAGWNSAKDLVEAIRKAPGTIDYASAGIGSPHHLAMEMLKESARLDITHIAYKGAAPAIQGVLSGQVPLMVVDTATGGPMLKAGRLQPLAVFSKERLPAFPDVPTLMELGYTDIETFAWQGMVVPAGTPKEVVAKLSGELQKALRTPEVEHKLREIGIEPFPSDAQTMAKYLGEELRYWPKLIRERHISLD